MGCQLHWIYLNSNNGEACMPGMRVHLFGVRGGQDTSIIERIDVVQNNLLQTFDVTIHKIQQQLLLRSRKFCD